MSNRKNGDVLSQLQQTGAARTESFGISVPCRVLLFAPSPPPYGGMALQAQLLKKLLLDDGIDVTFFPANLPFPKALRFLERLRVVRALLRSAMVGIRLWRPLRNVEVVHVFAASWVYFFLSVVPVVLLGRARGKRVVLNYRGGEAERFFQKWGWAAGPVIKMASEVTAPSEFLAGVIRNRFQIPVRIVSNILDFSTFRFRERTLLRPRMLVTRHLEKMYDVESVLKGFRAVQEAKPEASLWIAGTGSQEVRLRGLAAEWDLKNVVFMGGVPHKHLREAYDACDILLNCSRVDNFPGSLLEASASGLAIVTTAAGGIPFLYQHEKNALMVEPGDWQGIARAVLRLLAEPALAQRLTGEGKVLAAQCRWQEVRQDLYASYGFSLEIAAEKHQVIPARESVEV